MRIVDDCRTVDHQLTALHTLCSPTDEMSALETLERLGTFVNPGRMPNCSRASGDDPVQVYAARSFRRLGDQARCP